MNFAEAEEKFRELQARVQRGEALSEEQYQEELAKLMVQDDRGTFWSLEPGTGRWLYFNGTEWMPGTPPRPAPAVEPPPPIVTPVEPAPATAATSAAAGGALAGAAAAGATTVMASGINPTPVTPDNVPTYVRPAEAGEPVVDRPAGLAPRPVRNSAFVNAPAGGRSWLPFALGAIVLSLCAAVLFFFVRGLPFVPGNAGTATVTQVASRVTPTPTEAALPTDTLVVVSTAVPTTAAGTTPTSGVVTVTTTDTVRVRAGPGTTFAIIGKLATATTVTAVGRNADSTWVQVQLPGSTNLGWVSAEFLKVTSGDLNSLPVVQVKAGPTAKPGAKPTATETPAG